MADAPYAKSNAKWCTSRGSADSIMMLTRERFPNACNPLLK